MAKLSLLFFLLFLSLTSGRFIFKSQFYTIKRSQPSYWKSDGPYHHPCCYCGKFDSFEEYGSISLACCQTLRLSFVLNQRGNVNMVNGQNTWCVAKPSSDQATLLSNLNYACSQVDCKILEKGCPCSSPDNLINRASIAMNLYYQCRGKNHWNCDFRGSGLVVVTNPSYGNCIYA